MKDRKIVTHSLISALGVAFYTAGVAWFIINAGSIFGTVGNTFLAPMLFLLLLIVSATITGLLVLGEPAYLYLNGHKKTAVKTLGFTILFLFGIAVIVFVLLFTSSQPYR